MTTEMRWYGARLESGDVRLVAVKHLGLQMPFVAPWKAYAPDPSKVDDHFSNDAGLWGYK